ncbi:hypothetical protein E2320_006306 [Naja naja]|nr:hypothetical protein E2320_006306 [Naja naja]
MAAKRKGGLKLNAICAKLSRQVVVEHKAPEQGHVDKAPLGWESTGGETATPKEVAQAVAKEPGPKFSEGTKIEEDKRREVIEKWVNGEYSEDPLLGRIESKEPKAPEGTEVPPEGVYMVQPKGCSDDEDNGDEAEPAKDSQDGSFVDDRDSDGPPLKDESFRASNSEASSKHRGGATSGETAMRAGTGDLGCQSVYGRPHLSVMYPLNLWCHSYCAQAGLGTRSSKRPITTEKG